MNCETDENDTDSDIVFVSENFNAKDANDSDIIVHRNGDDSVYSPDSDLASFEYFQSTNLFKRTMQTKRYIWRKTN